MNTNRTNIRRVGLVAGLGALVGLLTIGVAMAHGMPGGAFWGRGGADRGASISEEDGTVTGRFVNFTVESDGISAFTLQHNGSTVLLAERVSVMELADGESHGLRKTYVLRDDDVALRVADTPFALLGVRAMNGTSVSVVLPEGATVVLHEAVEDWSPAGATITYGEVKANLRLSQGASINQEGSELSILLPGDGFLTLGGLRDGPMAIHAGFHGPGWHMGPGPRGHGHGPPR